MRDAFATIGLVHVIAWIGYGISRASEKFFAPKYYPYWRDKSACRCDNPTCRFHAC